MFLPESVEFRQYATGIFMIEPFNLIFPFHSRLISLVFFNLVFNCLS